MNRPTYNELLDLVTDLSREKDKNQRRERFNNSLQLTLGEFISKLSLVDQEKVIVFDFDGSSPQEPISWRGDYYELAITYEKKDNLPKVKEILPLYKEAVGKTFQGYKGGSFVMTRHTPIWAAEYSGVGNSAIIDVKEEKNTVIIITQQIIY